MPNIVDIILPTFFVILIGYLIGKLAKIQIASVVDIAIYIAAPALVFITLLNREIVLLDAAKVWVSSAVIMLGCGVIAWLVYKLLKQKHSGLYVSISMMNTIHIPFPLIYLAYGAEGLIAATLFCIPNVLLLNSLGIYIMAGKRWRENIREVFKIPVIYAAALGLIFNLFGIGVPELVTKPLDLIAMMTLPLVLLILGYNLSGVKMTSFPATLLASVLRIGIG